MEGNIPASMHSDCEECDAETLHRTLKGRFAGKKKLDMVLKCSECGNVKEERFELASKVQVRLIISRGDESSRTTMEMQSDWVMTVGEELMHEDERLLVTGIEVDERRVNSASANNIQTLWTKNFDTVQIHVSINKRGRTTALLIDAVPEEEFSVGDDIEIDGRPAFIHSIKTTEKKIRIGTVQVRDIVRIYCTDKRGMRGKRKPFNPS